MEFKGTFEEGLKRLEEIVQGLEQGDKSLDESIKMYEEGMAIVNFCTAKLEEAEEKIKRLNQTEDGDFILEDME
ncbi:MAG: hypothetical protein Kow00108_06400 [Calditrichia bacterium]